MQEFYRRHVCRLDPWPEALQRTADQLEGNQVYLTMNGPTEFDVIGSLRDWDRTADIHRIASPTPTGTVGRHDELTPACSETLRDGIADARTVVFEESAHCADLRGARAVPCGSWRSS